MTNFAKVAKWSRPADIIKGNRTYAKPSLWGKATEMMQGLKQGMLGDCWVLGSAAAIAENPERATFMFYQ
jgi:hypothetical protein